MKSHISNKFYIACTADGKAIDIIILTVREIINSDNNLVKHDLNNWRVLQFFLSYGSELRHSCRILAIA